MATKVRNSTTHKAIRNLRNKLCKEVKNMTTCNNHIETLVHKRNKEALHDYGSRDKKMHH